MVNDKSRCAVNKCRLSYAADLYQDHQLVQSVSFQYHMVYQWRIRLFITNTDKTGESAERSKVNETMGSELHRHLSLMEIPRRWHWCRTGASADHDFVNCSKDHFGYGLGQWETTLHCNVVSHWLSPNTKWAIDIRCRAAQYMCFCRQGFFHSLPSDKIGNFYACHFQSIDPLENSWIVGTSCTKVS